MNKLLKKIKEKAEGFEPEKTGIDFLDDRVEEMRNPFGYVALYYQFFYWLTKNFEFPIMVELGSWQGTSAAHLAAGSPESLVITIDHHTDPGDEVNHVKTVEATQIFKNLKYIQGWTCNQLYKEQYDKHSAIGHNAYPEVLKLLDGRKIYLLFIDSWHEYNQAMKDWEAYSPLLAEGALVICDDIMEGTPGSGIDNMMRFWNELPGEKYLNTRLHNGYPMGFLIYEK